MTKKCSREREITGREGQEEKSTEFWFFTFGTLLG